MALVECKVCKRAFINGPEEDETCPECKSKLNEIYPIVRNFLRDNERKLYTANDVSRILGIDLKTIEGLIAMGLIQTAEKKTDHSSAITPSRVQREPEERYTKGGSSMHKYSKKKGDRH